MHPIESSRVGLAISVALSKGDFLGFRSLSLRESRIRSPPLSIQ